MLSALCVKGLVFKGYENILKKSYTIENKLFKSSYTVYLLLPFDLVTSFLTTYYLIRYLPVPDMGAYNLIGSMLVFYSFLTSFGLESVLNRYIPEYISNENYYNIRELFFFSFGIRFISSLVIGGILYALSQKISVLFNFTKSLENVFLLVLIYLFLNSIKAIFQGVVSAYLEAYKVRYNVIGTKILTLIFIVFIIHNKLAFKELIISLLIVCVLSNIHMLCLGIMKMNKLKKHPKIKPIEYMRVCKYGIYSYLSTSTGIFKQLVIDNFIISYFMNMSNVAFYNYGASFVGYVKRVNPLLLLRGAINVYMVRKYYDKDKDISILRDGVVFQQKIYLFFVLPIFIGIALLGEPITKYVFMPEYLVSLPVMYILIASYLVGDLIYSFGIVTIALERLDISLYGNLFSIYNLFMNIILVKKYGIEGIALATGSTVIFSYIYYYIMVKKILKIPISFPFESLLKVIVNIIPMIVFLYLVRDRITTIPEILLSILIAIIIYLAISLRNKVFSKKEQNILNNLIGRKIWVF